MQWRVLSYAIVVGHLYWVSWIIWGPLWCWKRPGWRAYHLACVWWTYFVFAQGVYCPMTKLENALQASYDPSKTYLSGFVIHYVRPMLWWDLTQPQIVTALTLWTVSLTVVYAWLWARESARDKLKGDAGKKS